MTEITILYAPKRNRHRDTIVGIEYKGHAGADICGRDIVCASVSVCLEALEYGLRSIADINGIIVISESKKQAIRSILWQTEDAEREGVRAITETIAGTLCNLAATYSDFLSFEEKEITDGKERTME